jgi:hypothetical protein
VGSAARRCQRLGRRQLQPAHLLRRASYLYCDTP